MKTIYLVIAFGGQYDDAWRSNIRAFSTPDDALNLVVCYQNWIEEIRKLEVPESLQEYNWDFEDERAAEMYEESMQEFKRQVLIDMGVPEDDFDHLLENWDTSYGCDRPHYLIDELEFA